MASKPKSGLRKYTLNGGLFTLPLRGLLASSFANSCCLGENLSGEIIGKRALSCASRAAGMPKANASSAMVKSFFIRSSRTTISLRQVLSWVLLPLAGIISIGENVHNETQGAIADCNCYRGLGTSQELVVNLTLRSDVLALSKQPLVRARTEVIRRFALFNVACSLNRCH